MKVFDEIFHSLRLRVFFVVLIVGILPSLCLKEIVVRSYQEWAVSNLCIEVQSQCNSIANQLISTNYLYDQNSDQINTELSQLSNIYGGRIIVADRSLRIVKDTYSVDEGKTLVSSSVVQCIRKNTTISQKYDRYVELTIPVVDNLKGSSQEMVAVLLISIPIDNVNSIGTDLATRLQLVLLFIAIITISVAVLFSHSVVNPFIKMTNSIEEWGEEADEEAISKTMTEFSETHLIAQSFSSLLSKMKSVDKGRQEFVSNVSHELKTPLTSMKVMADSLISMGEVPVEMYREFMSDMSEEIDRENKIINDLLSLVKMDKTEAKPQIVSQSVNQLIETILKRLRPIAKKQNIELVYESFREVTADIDEVKFTLAISNLVENAIKYNRENGWVHVSLDADHKDMYITVEDSGIGIPNDCMNDIFERFYRVDKSHSREIGGTGLGLAITKNAILMHHGTVKVSSKLGEGTTFTVRIPLNYIE